MKKLYKDFKKYKNEEYGIIINFLKIILNPGFITMIFFRIADFIYCINRKYMYFFSKIIMLIPRILFGIEIEIGAEIGEGFKIVHGNGIVIGHKVKIGKNVIVAQQVTIGGNNLKKRELDGKILEQPIIKDGVRISPGAKVIGPIIVGENALIGVNSVITKDVSDNMIMIGNNQKLREKKNENSIYK